MCPCPVGSASFQLSPYWIVAWARRCWKAVRGRLGQIVACALPLVPLHAQLRWVRRTPLNSPAPRSGAAMAYDWARGRTVLFGGGSAAGAFSDTWEWDGSNWNQRIAAPSPRGQSSMAMAYDLVRGRMVLLETGYAADTWEWDGTTWTLANPVNRPPPRSGHALAYDIFRGQVVLFGGFQSAALGDTWTWDGTTWTQQFPAQSPGPRGDCAIASDLARGVVVLFGGHGATTYSDTWEWDGTTWWQRFPASTPLHVLDQAMAYDTLRSRCLYLGSWGLGPPPAAEWDGVNWSRCTTAASFPARARFALAYDLGRKVMVLFGGLDAAGRELDETWELPIQIIPASLTCRDGGGTSEAPARWAPVHMQSLYDPSKPWPPSRRRGVASATAAMRRQPPSRPTRKT